MSEPTTEERVKAVLGEYLKKDPDAIQGPQDLQDDLGLDSMSTIELLYEIEETFGLQIADDELAGLSTVNDVIAYVEGKI